MLRICISNPDALTCYREQAGPALARRSGKVEQLSPTSIALDGAPKIPDVAAILSLPDAEAAFRSSLGRTA